MKLIKPMAALVMGAAFFISQPGFAASCCGGGSASSLVLPKFSKAMVDVSFDYEHYDGYWQQNGDYVEQPDYDLNQYRLNLGYAHRLAERWQTSVTLPYVWNDNNYPAYHSKTSGFGDTTVNLWYEAFDGIQCVWKVRKPQDLIPATYFGASLTLPTGISPYDKVDHSEDITGRGFYRLDATVMLDKTIYPWNMTFVMSYGKHLERPVNREGGDYVEPYDKNLGDRFFTSISGGYTLFLENMDTLTFTLSTSYLQEDEGTINGHSDPTTGMMKRSNALTMAYATLSRDWVVKLTYSHTNKWDGQGENFPATDVTTLGVSHVFR